VWPREGTRGSLSDYLDVLRKLACALSASRDYTEPANSLGSSSQAPVGKPSPEAAEIPTLNGAESVAVESHCHPESETSHFRLLK
jgi:hypothetical protein